MQIFVMRQNFSASILISVIVVLILSGCGPCQQSATFPSRWLPAPWPGYHGSGETLTKGSAFGVSIGMSRQQAEAKFGLSGRFHRTGVFCGIGGANELKPDINVPATVEGKPDTICPVRDNVDEIWRAEPSIFCGLCQSEIVDVFISGNRVSRIEFQGSGCVVG